MSSRTENLVEIRGLSKSFGAFKAVRDLNFSVSYGQIFALLGPNGAGKTTTIRMLMGILVPTSGSARIDGLDCFRDRVDVKRRVGYLPDEPVFHDYLRGSEIIRFTGEMHGLSRSEIEDRTRLLVQQLELNDALEEFAVNYSRGMKKKLALVCAMLHDPALLILDEPTSGLDPFATRSLHELMRANAAAGKTIFLQHSSSGPGGKALHTKPAGDCIRGRNIVASVDSGEHRTGKADPAGELGPRDDNVEVGKHGEREKTSRWAARVP